MVAIPFEVGQVSTKPKIEVKVDLAVGQIVAIPFEVGQVSTDLGYDLDWNFSVAIPFEVGQVSTRCIETFKNRPRGRNPF